MRKWPQITYNQKQISPASQFNLELAQTITFVCKLSYILWQLNSYLDIIHPRILRENTIQTERISKLCSPAKRTCFLLLVLSS